LVLSGSAGGLVVTIVGLAILMTVRFWQSERLRPVLLAALGIAVSYSSVVLTRGITLSALTGLVGRDATLTGRTELWTHLLAIVHERPLLGYGFGAFWETPVASKLRTEIHFDSSLSSAHDGLLDIALALGVVGVIAALVVLASILGKGVADGRAGHHDLACLRIFVVSVALGSTVIESGLFNENLLLTLLLFIAAGMRRPVRGGYLGRGGDMGRAHAFDALRYMPDQAVRRYEGWPARAPVVSAVVSSSYAHTSPGGRLEEQLPVAKRHPREAHVVSVSQPGAGIADSGDAVPTPPPEGGPAAGPSKAQPLVYPPVVDNRPSGALVGWVAVAVLLLLIAVGIQLVRQGTDTGSPSSPGVDVNPGPLPKAATAVAVTADVTLGPGRVLVYSQHVVFDRPQSSITLTQPLQTISVAGNTFAPRMGGLQIVVGLAGPVSVPDTPSAGRSLTVRLPTQTSELDLRYVTNGAVVRSAGLAAYPASALLTPLTISPTQGDTTIVHFNAKHVTGITCTASGASSTPCGAKKIDGWTVTYGPDDQGMAVVAELDLRR
jgi:hypothetical protein